MEKSQSWGGQPGYLALGSDESSVLIARIALTKFDLLNWREMGNFNIAAGEISSLAISMDSLDCLAGYVDGTIRVIDLVDALDTQQFNTSMQPDSIVTSPDGKYLLIGNMFPSDPNLTLWDVANAKAVKTYPGFSRPSHSITLAALRTTA